MPAIVKPGAVGFYTEDGKLVREEHSSKCFHCQTITDFPSMKEMMNHVELCRGCMKLICLKCYGQPCVPAEKRAEMKEHAYRLQQRINIGAWRCY